MSVTRTGPGPTDATDKGHFRGRTLTRETRPLVLDETRPGLGLRLPDSEESLVIGPDDADPPVRS